MKQKVSDYIFDYIAARTGAKTVFMLPGGGCMHLVDSLGRNKALDYVCCLHEQAAAIAAEAYAQDRCGLGVLLVTAGPGSTNAVTGIAGAWIDSTPVLVLSGQAKTTDMMTGKGVRQMGIQEVDTVSIVRPVTKYAVCVKDPERIRFELEKAVWTATHGRKGPVWIDLPLDVQGAFVDPELQEGFVPPAEKAPDAAAAAAAVLAGLRGAKRPLVYAGQGVRAAGALPDFLKMIEKLRIPTALSWRAADFLAEDHPLYVGRPGIIASRGANFAQQTCDCLLILGTRLDLCQTGFNAPHFAPRAKKFMVDIDRAEMDKLELEFAGKFVMDAGSFISAVLAADPAPLDSGAFLARCKNWRKKYPVILPEYCDESKKLVNIYHFVKVLSEEISSDAVLIPGSSGACAEVTMQCVQVKPGLRVHNTPGLGSMGFGLPAVIGGCIASGGRKTVGIVGDGGVMHNIQDLETLARLRLPVVLFIWNNNGYGSIRGMQDNRFSGNRVACDPGSGLTIPDFSKLVPAFGLAYRKIESPKELAKQMRDVLNSPGPLVCEVMTDPAVQTAPRLSSKVFPDGSMQSMPMEDLAPFLDEKELRENLEADA